LSQAYPLSWPPFQKRTNPYARNSKQGAGRLTVARAVDQIVDQVRMLRGQHLIVSSNIELRQDGWPRSNQRTPYDPGVAVYFEREGVKLVFACDRHPKPEQNMRAIAQHLEAMRGMERWGVGTTEQAFAGYRALPEDSTPASWWSVLGLEERPASLDELRQAYRVAARGAHPDTGGSNDLMAAVNRAYEAGQRELGGAS
jgi:hypothetical protein